MMRPESHGKLIYTFHGTNNKLHQQTFWVMLMVQFKGWPLKQGLQLIKFAGLHDFGAMEKGVFVSWSTGNGGPDPTSLVNVSPWSLLFEPAQCIEISQLLLSPGQVNT
ncbi:unnamed protein product [Fraxinus pennsylvanica]|uniref:Uncharacterized protein n=1 Tax=Fraxinus pennsylvanica TaxID=56036 RepID=A0AAD1ZL66_9LAMI|nr:unnamed protein product [Fraxinus pennsylvanica]